MITFACVRTGEKYGPEYVVFLRRMIERYYPYPFRFVCLTDQAETYPHTDNISVKAYGLKTWFAKMLLFHPQYRGGETSRVIYLDLDTVIINDLLPLTAWNGIFGICENFTRLAGHESWPCRYGSCAMSFAPGWGMEVFQSFIANRDALLQEKYGDQKIIETLVPMATLLQSVTPKGFFLNKRKLPEHPTQAPPEASVVVFGGNEKPHNCKVEWVKKAWCN